jgi:hypothetical protein
MLPAARSAGDAKKARTAGNLLLGCTIRGPCASAWRLSWSRTVVGRWRRGGDPRHLAQAMAPRRKDSRADPRSANEDRQAYREAATFDRKTIRQSRAEAGRLATVLGSPCDLQRSHGDLSGPSPKDHRRSRRRQSRIQIGFHAPSRLTKSRISLESRAAAFKSIRIVKLRSAKCLSGPSGTVGSARAYPVISTSGGFCDNFGASQRIIVSVISV